MDEEMGMMAPEPEEFVNPFSPDEVQEIQTAIDSTPVLGSFINEIAAVDPMEYGISTVPPEPMGAEMAPEQPMMV